MTADPVTFPDLPSQQNAVAVLGAGAWGTAIAIALARGGRAVRLYARRADHAQQLRQTRINEERLPGYRLPDSIEVLDDARQAVSGAGAIFLVAPSRAIAPLARAAAAAAAPGAAFIVCAKGLDDEGEFLAEAVAKIWPKGPVLVLSGPSFAEDVAAGKHTIVAFAGPLAVARSLSAALSSVEFVLAPTSDLRGVQLAGVCKNVAAILCGASDGMKGGANTRAALMSEAIRETSQLVLASGGDMATLLGPAGFGDFALTCTDPQSRNYRLGFSLASGHAETGRTQEGAVNAQALMERAAELGVDVPLIEAVVDLVQGRISVADAVRAAFAQRLAQSRRFVTRPGGLAPASSQGGHGLVLATDLDGTFLGGSDQARAELYARLQARQDLLLIFVTGRDVDFIKALIAQPGMPRPRYIVGDVGTSVYDVEAGFAPVEALEADIAARWDNANARVIDMLKDEPGLTLQPTPFRHRVSYYYDPAVLRAETVHKVEEAGFDCLMSAGKYLDVLPRGIAKGPTLRRMVQTLGLPSSQVLVAGDTVNDLSMFEAGFKGVAVANSEPRLLHALPDSPRIYRSAGEGAAGIAEAIAHFSLD